MVGVVLHALQAPARPELSGTPSIAPQLLNACIVPVHLKWVSSLLTHDCTCHDCHLELLVAGVAVTCPIFFQGSYLYADGRTWHALVPLASCSSLVLLLVRHLMCSLLLPNILCTPSGGAPGPRFMSPAHGSSPAQSLGRSPARSGFDRGAPEASSQPPRGGHSRLGPAGSGRHEKTIWIGQVHNYPTLSRALSFGPAPQLHYVLDRPSYLTHIPATQPWSQPPRTCSSCSVLP